MSFFSRILFLLIASVCVKAAYAEGYQYTMSPGDVLEISVWKEDTLQRELRVLPDGTISFPLSGVISVEGKSIKAVQTELTKKLAEYINDPVVNIIVKSVEGNTVYVLGQVKTPGRFVMYQPLDVMQALTLAGGLTPFAKANNIVILRRNKGSSEAINFEYGDLEEGKWLYKNHVLKNGDVIVVP